MQLRSLAAAGLEQYIEPSFFTFPNKPAISGAGLSGPAGGYRAHPVQEPPARSREAAAGRYGLRGTRGLGGRGCSLFIVGRTTKDHQKEGFVQLRITGMRLGMVCLSTSLLLTGCGADKSFDPATVSLVGLWTFSESNTLVGNPTLNPCDVSNVPLSISSDTLGSTTDTINGGWIGHFGTTGVEACSVGGGEPQPNPYEYADHDVLITRIGDSLLVRTTSNKHLYVGAVVAENRLSGIVDTGTGRSGTWTSERGPGQ
jgi:hypothetical protein